jgi:hypothetical protein
MTACQEVTEDYPEMARAKPEKMMAGMEGIEAAVGSSKEVWTEFKSWIWGQIQKQ